MDGGLTVVGIRVLLVRLRFLVEGFGAGMVWLGWTSDGEEG